MKRLLLVGLAGLSVFNASFADAADIDIAASPAPSRVIVPAPYFEWFGLYVGAIGGGGWENIETNYTFSSVPTAATNDFEDIFGTVSSAIAQGFLPTGFA